MHKNTIPVCISDEIISREPPFRQFPFSELSFRRMFFPGRIFLI